jgi:hypothetical protein
MRTKSPSTTMGISVIGLIGLTALFAGCSSSPSVDPSSSPQTSGTAPVVTTTPASSGVTTLGSNATCGQYLKASTAAQTAFVRTFDSELAINPSNTSYWVPGITGICQAQPPQATVNQALVNLGYLGPGQ